MDDIAFFLPVSGDTQSTPATTHSSTRLAAAPMSKGKRKSDPEALKIVRDRLRCRHQARFTEQDRALLGKLCRTDLIEIIERDLALGPLRASQKNSVASMVHWLLRW